ncbi:hypothetical protein C4D60_Mb05t27350 [Musa balbisiana]|uniref:Uncharacterized protein n=1 Tax=Musa balbisiana TaxID=52838 RepID=A0A4S8JZB6_MUSBA|nr:hypothetical protein C4D60_Mb05t27350 [Musa balbisiana]
MVSTPLAGRRRTQRVRNPGDDDRVQQQPRPSPPSFSARRTRNPFGFHLSLIEEQAGVDPTEVSKDVGKQVNQDRYV